MPNRFKAFLEVLISFNTFFKFFQYRGQALVIPTGSTKGGVDKSKKFKMLKKTARLTAQS